MRNMFHTVLVAGALSLGLGLGQPCQAAEYEEAAMNMELRQRQLEIEQIEGEIAFENQMRELDLEGRRVEIDAMRDATHGDNGGGEGLALLLFVTNILMAVWVYADNRRRDAGYGIWIVITLLSGFLGALVYSVIRLGDVQATRPAATRTAAPKK